VAKTLNKSYSLDMASKTTKEMEPSADEEARFLAAVDEGLADMKAGRSVPYEKVRRWLLSWGSKKELPPPSCQSDSRSVRS
jgi:predicted transcriptional regulator